MTKIYHVELAHGKHYICHSRQSPAKLFTSLLNGNGPQWTRLHKPVSILRIYYDQLQESVTEVVEAAMVEFGYENVRGGLYCDTILAKETLKHIQSRIWMRQGFCGLCGSGLHRTELCAEPSTEPISYLRETEKPIACFHCHRAGHIRSGCPFRVGKKAQKNYAYPPKPIHFPAKVVDWQLVLDYAYSTENPPEYGLVRYEY